MHDLESLDTSLWSRIYCDPGGSYNSWNMYLQNSLSKYVIMGHEPGEMFSMHLLILHKLHKSVVGL